MQVHKDASYRKGYRDGAVSSAKQIEIRLMELLRQINNIIRINDWEEKEN